MAFRAQCTAATTTQANESRCLSRAFESLREPFESLSRASESLREPFEPSDSFAESRSSRERRFAARMRSRVGRPNSAPASDARSPAALHYPPLAYQLAARVIMVRARDGNDEPLGRSLIERGRRCKRAPTRGRRRRESGNARPQRDMQSAYQLHKGPQGRSRRRVLIWGRVRWPRGSRSEIVFTFGGHSIMRPRG